MSMENKQLPKKYCTGRMEFIALIEDAEKLLKMGETQKSAYEFFFNSGRFTLSYDTFCYHAKNFGLITKRKSKMTKANLRFGNGDTKPTEYGTHKRDFIPPRQLEHKKNV